jgi:glycosyl transferase family 25
MEFETLVISLDTPGGRERQQRLAGHLGEVGLAYRVIRGVHGKRLSPAERREIATPACAQFCTPSTIGCAASHAKAWRRAARSGRPYTLVLEDDVELDLDARDVIQRVLKRVPSDADVIVLGCYLCATTRNRGSRSTDLIRIRQFSGTHAYIVTQRGAQRLLDYATPVKFHVDMVMSSLNHTGILTTYALATDIARQAGGESTSENVGETPGFPNTVYNLTRHLRDPKGQSIYFLVAMPAFRVGETEVTVLDLVVFLLGVAGLSPAVFTSLVVVDTLASWRVRGVIKASILYAAGRAIYLLWKL